MKRLSKIAERSDRIDDSSQRTSGPISLLKQMSQPEEQAKLPCAILPQVRTTRFFNCTDVIRKIEDHFSMGDPKRLFRSFAIFRLGGVGKSSVALKYAEAKLRNGELDALFWVHSEMLVSIRHSFTDIALRLKLPDARAGDHNENHALVLNWLQHTGKSGITLYCVSIH